MEIQMGNGEWTFSKEIASDGRTGLLIQKAEKAHQVGDLDHDAAGPVELSETAIFIAVPDLK